MKKARLILLILTLALPLSAISCKRDAEPMTKTYYEYFDTVCHVSSYGNESEEEFSDRCAELEALLKKYHRLFDIYREYEGVNNLATVNKNAGVSPVKTEPELVEFLMYAKDIYTLTDGEVNVAMGAVLSLWHDHREAATSDPKSATLPTDTELAEAAKHIFIDSLIIDKKACTVYINDEKASLDVGALGKGYVAERAAEALSAAGVSSYVLNFGGNIRAVGSKPDGEGWITGITNPDPRSSQAFAARVMLSDTSCVTSGSYERYFTVNGKNYHHIIDRDTLYPAGYFTSVSVITKDSALADALSTALFSMSYDDGLALCKKIGAVEVIWVEHDGTLLMTEGINAILIK